MIVVQEAQDNVGGLYDVQHYIGKPHGPMTNPPLVRPLLPGSSSNKDLLVLIHVIRGHRVMLDSDLASLYGVETKALNRAVGRNPARFPADFMFQLTIEESRI